MTTAIRVLILEDQPTDADLVLYQLRQAGFDAAWQRVDTEQDFLARLDPLPDLILADHSLPSFDSLSALKLVQERGLDIPFILVSASIGEELAVEAIKRGASDYLLKDRLARLGVAVQNALEQKRVRSKGGTTNSRYARAKAGCARSSNRPTTLSWRSTPRG